MHHGADLVTTVTDSPAPRSESADYRPLFKLNDENVSRIPKWMLNYTPPPYELVDHGLCSPDTAWIFDPRTHEEVDEVGYGAAAYRIKTAQRICQGGDYHDGCPVREQCLAYGIDNELTGVFGGELLTEARIKKIKAEAQIKERLDDPTGGSDRRVDAGPGEGVVDDDRPEVHGGRSQDVQADQRAQAVIPADRQAG